MTSENFDNPDFSIFAGILSAFLCIIFGSNAVAIKLAFSGVGVFTSAAIRFSIAALAIWIWARVSGKPLAPSKGRFYLLLIFLSLHSPYVFV
jgi:drug/metabolite transporter (DMT)-like permease